MAAPVKAFIDPTYLSRMVPAATIPKVFWPPLRSFTPDPIGAIIQQVPEDERLPLFAGALAKPGYAFYARVPTPPMGRLAILTFPPIYKERGAGGFTTGQLFPPANPPRLT